jgi:hypothetical protein
MNRRLRNAAIASSVVALAQQLSGINIMAFYGGSVLVKHTDPSTRLPDDTIKQAMAYNVVLVCSIFSFACRPFTTSTVSAEGRSYSSPFREWQ